MRHESSEDIRDTAGLQPYTLRLKTISRLIFSPIQLKVVYYRLQERQPHMDNPVVQAFITIMTLTMKGITFFPSSISCYKPICAIGANHPGLLPALRASEHRVQ